MATKKTEDLLEAAAEALDATFDATQTFNPLLVALHNNDKKNLFKTNVHTAFIKTGFPLFDYYFGSVVNTHDDMGKLVGQEARVGQAAGTFNLLIGGSGSGKSLPNSTMIPTPTGWKSMGEIKIGDEVFAHSGKPTKVLGVFPQGKLDTVEITLDDGRIARCSKDHLWTAFMVPKDKHLRGPGGDNDIDGQPLATITFDEMWVQSEYYDFYIPCIHNKISTASSCLLTYEGETFEVHKYVDWRSSESEECTCIYVEDDEHLFMIDQGIFTHNTTLGAQIAGNIIRQFKYSMCIHFDCEQRFDVSRAETITKLPASFFDSVNGERYMIKTGSVGLDTIQEMIVKMYVQKMKLKDQLTVSSGFKDEFGRDVMMLEPTMVLIDSITTVLSETFNPDSAKEAADAEGLRANTEGARDAKTLKGFFKDVIPLLNEANIIVYGINHINSNMSMNAFIPVAKQQNFLKQDESIPGGKTMIYYPFNIVKLTAKPSDDFTVEGDGFAGHMVMVEPIKSSSNQSGNNSKGISFELVFSHKEGFDNLRSLVMYGRDHGQIEGNKARLKFKDDPSCSFTWRNIDKEAKEKPIYENIKQYIIPSLNIHLPFVDPSEHEFDMRSLDY